MDDQVVLSSGSQEIPADGRPRSAVVPASERARLGVSTIGRTWTLSTASGAALDLAVSGLTAGARGKVTVRVALAGGSTGNAAQDLAAAGLSVRSGSVIDRGAWLEAVGDGFSRITIAGALTSGQVLVLEREENGKRTHGAVSLGIGPRGPANPTVPGTTAYAGIKSSTTIYSSDAPIFGLPALSGNGDRVSIAAYDAVYVQGGVAPPSGLVACVMPDVERRQRRFQLDTISGAATMGETQVQGSDAASWRDTEMAGLYNVIAIAQSGGEGVTVSVSLDRGATFPLSAHLGTGAWSRLVQVRMGDDYTIGVLFWASDATLGGQHLRLAEGTPTGFDAAGSPSGYAFSTPQTLLALTDAVTPLVSDLGYSRCGDLFVAYGYMETSARPTGGWARTTHVGSFRRLSGGALEGPTKIDTMELMGFDPSVSVLGCGGSAQVFVGYEGTAGVRLAKSADGGRTFGVKADAGTPSANTPQVFARTIGGKDVVDCLFVDGSADAMGWDLCLLRVDADLASGRSLHRVLETKTVTAASGATDLEGLGWMGFDATELNGDLFVAVHTQRTQLYAPGTRFGGAGIFATMGAGGSGAAAPPAVLYPGMTQPVPAVDPLAPHKLGVLRLE